MLNEPTGISCLTAADAQRILERRERTDPSGVLDQDSPDCSRNVQPRDPGPAHYEETPQNHEEDESEVDDQYEVSQPPVNHT